MKPRRVPELNNLGDEKFFSTVAEGLELLVEHCERLEQGARLLASNGHGRASQILELVCKEEAAKYLILLDAVRCPVQPQAVRSRQLRRFHDHLARGIYAEVVGWRPSTFGQLESYILPSRQQFYLDGPNDVDWVFRNEILRTREEAFYVDYVETDEGKEWVAPHPVHDSVSWRMYAMPEAVSVVRALHATGFASAQALAIIARIWRPYDPRAESPWQEIRNLTIGTLQALEHAGLLTGESIDHQRVVDKWPYPLWSADLSEVKVPLDELRSRQAEWHPDSYY